MKLGPGIDTIRKKKQIKKSFEEKNDAYIYVCTVNIEYVCEIDVKILNL